MHRLGTVCIYNKELKKTEKRETRNEKRETRNENEKNSDGYVIWPEDGIGWLGMAWHGLAESRGAFSAQKKEQRKKKKKLIPSHPAPCACCMS